MDALNGRERSAAGSSSSSSSQRPPQSFTQPNSQPAGKNPSRRTTRSKSGCLTCRSRKVRCDETRQRCSHCFRLNLECRWPSPFRSSSIRSTSKALGPERDGSRSSGFSSHITDGPSAQKRFELVGSEDVSESGFPANQMGAVNQIFDYASFMWDSVMPEAMYQLTSDSVQPDIDPLGPRYYNNDPSNNSPRHGFGISINAAPQLSVDSIPQVAMNSTSPRRVALPAWESQSEPSTGEQEQRLIDYFISSAVPPVLAEVEIQKRWSSMRQMLISMSNTSTMIRYSILAFSNLLSHRQQTPWLEYPYHYYDRAVSELSAASKSPSNFKSEHHRQNALTTLFFLSYVDILQDRVNLAHEHLRQAYDIFQQEGAPSFRPMEIRLLSWLRMLDARAAWAGGEGLFLSDSSERLLSIQPSPASLVDSEENFSKEEESQETNVEDALFQVLYHQGIIFFQKVQSFMGRIVKLDPWHRSRGTVEDETEVITIAARISKDLRLLYDQRSVLMDPAIAGALAPPHVSANIGYTITRVFRTYLSNYYASKVHLHRVAYKQFPLSRETIEALDQIRNLTRSMVETLEPGSVLPVSQLWPLLMLGCEEKDPVERAWIKEQILNMETVATNAKITAQVLDEVQLRQDKGQARVDIREVMHAIFDSCYAITII